jgi:hypothetical protein
VPVPPVEGRAEFLSCRHARIDGSIRSKAAILAKVSSCPQQMAALGLVRESRAWSVPASPQ